MSTEKISDRDLERFFAGQMPDDERLARLMPALQALHSRFIAAPSEELAGDLVARASQTALQTRPGPLPRVSPTRTVRALLPRLGYRLGAFLAALVLISGMTGVAVASNGAAPGDVLYGLDRALEAIGINDGAAAERISEAQQLFDRGRAAEALAHAAVAVESSHVEDGAAAAEQLRSAADRLLLNQKGQNAQATLTSVADMLDWMATTDPRGRDFGKTISEMAKGIREGTDLPGSASDGQSGETGPGDPPGAGQGNPGGNNGPGSQGKSNKGRP